ncbi:MAG: ADP-ribose pyrophosphatase, partial [bacterium]
VAYSFVAQDLRMGYTAPDDTELLTLTRIPLSDAINMAMDGTISDGLAMASLLKVGLLMSRGELSM